jgi:hypothetical protein
MVYPEHFHLFKCGLPSCNALMMPRPLLSLNLRYEGSLPWSIHTAALSVVLALRTLPVSTALHS